ncbi:MAG: glycerate kinase [Chloroflexi bacterium]|nr:glycerate kinase [Chloroflexota bacterium]
MRIVICPQAFKGGLRGMEAARAIATGLRRVFPSAEFVLLPVADGGDGTLEALVPAVLFPTTLPSPLAGEGQDGGLHATSVTGPLGEPVQAPWGVMAGGSTAVIELARASGLALLPPERRDPLRATTFGTGQLILTALDAGYRRIIVGLGGSATNDGGEGIARALGARFLDAAGLDLPPGGAALARLARIDLSRLDPRVKEIRILAATDVANPLCGPEGASETYGPQKGATPDMVRALDAALRRFGEVIEEELGVDVLTRPRMGAAGGAGAGLFALLGAEIGSGADIVCDALGVDAALEGAALAVVGEGRLDWQTAYDKAPIAVARRARAKGVPVIAVAGSLGPGYEALLGQGIALAEAATPAGMPLAEAMARAAELVADAAERAGRQAATLFSLTVAPLS